MDTLRAVIEKRINAFGVAEPIVQTETANAGGQQVHKLVVELPGVTNINDAIELIGKTPALEFRTEKATSTLADATSSEAILAQFNPTQLTGRYLESAQVQFDQNTNQPTVALVFNAEGKKLFAEITKANVGKVVAIFLDGELISAPVVRDEIRDGKAVISGRFTPAEAKNLAQDLRYGALPVPIQLIGTQTIGASLGSDALRASMVAGAWGFLIIALFLVLWYRLPGVIAIASLVMYTLLNMAIFKLIPVVLTSAGLAGFILSIGMAVDGNILIFERMKEELKRGLGLEDAIREGFSRAWLSIRDSNLSSIITAVILYTFATSALIRGFALVFLIGVLVSMFTAITVSRTFLLALGIKRSGGLTKFLFNNGLSGNKDDLTTNSK
jgi:protein-export membrane protein SecD